jgi:hypothetical protein
MSRVGICVVTSVILCAVVAVTDASPGIDEAASREDCTSNIQNPTLQATCIKCVAQKGKHYHYNMEICHAVKSLPPQPPATIAGTVVCEKFLSAPGQETAKSMCLACVTREEASIWARGKCKPAPDPDPAKMASQPLLDQTQCSLASAGKAANQRECSACVAKGGTYHRQGGACEGPTLTETTPAVAELRGCRTKDVAPERRKRCAACLGQPYNSFALVGNDAGQCVRDDWKFADAFKLPDEAPDRRIFYKRHSCTKHVDVKSPQYRACVDCIGRQQRVFVEGVCVKPDVAAKRARDLGYPPAEPPAVASAPAPATPPSRIVNPGENLLANGGLENEAQGKKSPSPADWALDAGAQLDGGIALSEAAARSGKRGLQFKASTSVSAKARLAPGKKYRLTFWAKATNVSPTAKLKSSIKVGTETPFKVRTVEGPVVASTVTEWTQTAIDFEASAGEDFAKLQIAGSFADKTGAFLVDDVELVLAP